MTDKEQIIMNETSPGSEQQRTCETCNMTAQGGYLNCEYVCAYKVKKLKDDLACKTQECEELKTENEELNDRMAEVTFRATGGRLSYSNYTLDAIEKAFNDQLEILSDQKVEEETKELEKEIEILEKEICNTRWGVNGDIQPTVFGKSLDEIHKILTEADRYHKECEELKSESFTRESLISMQEEEIARYRKALEEIEGMLQVIVESNKVYPLQSNLYKILDIISKAKGEE